MPSHTTQLRVFISTIMKTINDNADEVAELDRVIGEGDHLINIKHSMYARLRNRIYVIDFKSA